MKNEFYALSFQPEALEQLDQETLMTAIRVEAHVLDMIMQRPSAPGAGAHTRLQNFRRLTQCYSQRFGDVQPDLQWALRIAALFQTYLESAGQASYPYEPLLRPEIREADFRQLVATRRSVRAFAGEAEDRQLEQIIAYGTWAPNSCNAQALRYVVVKNPEIRRQLRTRGNHSIVAVLADLRFYSDGDIECPCHDTGAAVQNMLLGCHVLGLGACYMTDLAINGEKYRTLLQVAPYEKITALLWIGQCQQQALAPVRRQPAEVVRYL
ncbi:MAG: nitroreductase family protein [Opitutae bacterium]|nr:nitroreductase family protein [Opitutae bacterium]